MNTHPIQCSIGLLTYNNERHLERALESVKDFSEIIIADGGSTDRTIELAKKYGAKIIQQSCVGQGIEDFAHERNLILKEATSPWFFYLDSDEIMSPELRDAIGLISKSVGSHDAYGVRYLKTTPDGKTPFRTFKEYYQVRLFKTSIGAYFIKKVHEKVMLPQEASIGVLETPWYVPMDEGDLSFRKFTKKAYERTRLTAQMWIPHGLRDIWYHIVWYPVVQFFKALLRMVLVRFKWGGESIPARYELLRMWYAAMLSWQHIKVLFVQKTKNN